MRAALWGQPVEFDGNPDWEGVMHIARHHATDVLVADVASRLGAGLLPPTAMLQEMKAAMRFNFINQQKAVLQFHSSNADLQKSHYPITGVLNRDKFPMRFHPV